MTAANVLIVDDSKTARLITQRILSQTGRIYECSHAGSYDEAMAIFSPNEFSLLLIDINMPGKDGLELAATIKKLQSDANIIMVTANTQQSVQEKATELGVKVMAKPFTADKLSMIL